MAYALSIHDVVQDQIDALPFKATEMLADALELLSLVPYRGLPFNRNNPDGGVYELTHGDVMVVYLGLEHICQVDVLEVIWAGPD